MDELRRLAGPMLADSPIPPTPVAEIRRRAAARRARRRATALGLAAVIVLVTAGSALALSGREHPVQVGTSPGTTLVPSFDITIYMNPAATAAETSSVQQALMADPNVTGLVYTDELGSYARFRCLFADQPQLVESVQPDELPPSFGVDFVGGQAEVDRLYATIYGGPGVKEFSFKPGSSYRVPTSDQDTVPVHVTFPPGTPVGPMVPQSSPALRDCPVTGTTLR